MSVDPLGQIVPGVAGSPAAQTTGADAARTQQTAVNQKRLATARGRAKSAAGIPAADGKNLAPNDRDPDGRQGWVLPVAAEELFDGDPAVPDASTAAAGDGNQRGHRIDLVG